MLSHFFRKWWPWGQAEKSGTDERVTDGTLWHLLPAASPFFEVPALAEWIEAGRAVVVKQNLQRTVYRVPLPAGAVYVKVCRADTPRAWIREILRPAKARLEFENALRLRECGLGCTTPLAWGEHDSIWPGTSFIVTREQANAEPLDEFLSKHRNPTGAAVRRQLATELGRFFARLHEAGVRHPDPHPGNILVEVPASRVPHFFLLDLHAVRFGPPLDWTESRENLVLLNRWFQVRATRTDRARFWRAYSASRALPLPVDPAGQVEAATLASNLRFWAARTGRYVGNNRQFRQVKRGPLRGHASTDLPRTVLDALLQNPDAPFALPGVQFLKDSSSSTVAVVRLAANDPPRILKRFNLKKRFATLRNVLRPSPALRSWVNGQALLDRDIPTARPLLLLHRQCRRLPAEGYVLFEYRPDAVGLPEAVERGPKRKRELAERLGQLLRRMHERDVSHRDLKAPNILVGADGLPFLIDLVGVVTGRAVSGTQRVRELARLAASFADSKLITHSDRLRVLRVYLGTSTASWKSWWTRIADAVRAKMRRNARMGRSLG